MPRACAPRPAWRRLSAPAHRFRSRRRRQGQRWPPPELGADLHRV